METGRDLQRYAADPSVALTVARFSFRCGDESHRRIVSRARGRYDRDVDNTTEPLSHVFKRVSGSKGSESFEFQWLGTAEISNSNDSDPFDQRAAAGGERSGVYRHAIIVTIADARRERLRCVVPVDDRVDRWSPRALADARRATVAHQANDFR